MSNNLKNKHVPLNYSVRSAVDGTMRIKGNRTAHIRHQCIKATVLSCHRCLINTGVEKII
jgi:hypothetical protein